MEWILPNNTSVSTIFYQGMSQSQVQLAKYTGNRGFTATTGEHVVSQSSIDIIYEPFIGKEIRDVNLQPFSTYLSYVNLITHLFILKSLFVNWYQQIAVKRLTSSTESVYYHTNHFKSISIGQNSDILSHNEKYTLWELENKIQLILFGVSRGAATTFNSVCTNKYSNIKLVILEGCFYSIDDVLKKRFGFLSGFANYVLSYTSYKKDGPSPSKCIDQFPDDIPVVFISSLIDSTVPYASTKKLATELASKRKAPVYLLTLTKSRHFAYMYDDQEDANKYQCFMHAIYKKYNLPYIEEYASEGLKFIDESLII